MTDGNFLTFVGNRIQDVRSKRKMTQVELANRCGFGKASMSRIESGQVNLTLLTLKKICDGLEVRASVLMP